jgi:hypothetical protein
MDRVKEGGGTLGRQIPRVVRAQGHRGWWRAPGAGFRTMGYFRATVEAVMCSGAGVAYGGELWGRGRAWRSAQGWQVAVYRAIEVQ